MRDFPSSSTGSMRPATIRSLSIRSLVVLILIATGMSLVGHSSASATPVPITDGLTVTAQSLWPDGSGVISGRYLDVEVRNDSFATLQNISIAVQYFDSNGNLIRNGSLMSLVSRLGVEEKTVLYDFAPLGTSSYALGQQLAIPTDVPPNRNFQITTNPKWSVDLFSSVLENYWGSVQNLNSTSAEGVSVVMTCHPTISDVWQESAYVPNTFSNTLTPGQISSFTISHRIAGPSCANATLTFDSTSPPAPVIAPPATTTTTVPMPTTTTTAPPAPSQPNAVVKRSGYWMLGSDGAVYAFGDAKQLGNATNVTTSTWQDIESTPDGNGYWLVDAAGHVSCFGTALCVGQAAGSLGKNETVSSLSATPSGNGYWIFTNLGRALTYGDAAFHGDMSGVKLNGPVLDSVTTPSGNGYYMVASDGGIFAFGDAQFHGSMGGKRLNAPVQSLVPDGDGNGYWLVASDGGVFAFDAPFLGSMGSARLNKPVTGMVGFGSNGYLMVAEDGGIFAFGTADFRGSLGSNPPAHPITSVATLSR